MRLKGKIALLILLFMCLFSLTFAGETLTITTYYPSPYGVYNEMRLYPHTPAITACDATQEGLMYYDSNTHNLSVCRYNGTTYVWESGGGYWAASGNNIYNTNTGNVGVGTTTPNANLHVSGNNAEVRIDGVTGVPLLNFYSSQNADNVSNGRLAFINTSNVSGRQEIVSISARTIGIGTDKGGSILFNTKPQSAIEQSSMMITGSGNVGIGTTAPNNLIQVDKLINFDNVKKSTFLGFQAGVSNTNGWGGNVSSNTFVGYQAGFSNTSGFANTANGYWALYSNTTGAMNTAIGSGALQANTTGSSNVAIGRQALTSNTTGGINVAIGEEALRANTTGNYNIAHGDWALYSNTTGFCNTAIGEEALRANTTGYGNTALGYTANVSTGGLTNATAIGYNTIVNASNKVRIGNAAVTKIEGQVSWSVASDARLKENIKDSDLGLDFIKKLRPVSFKRKNGEGIDYGFIAQEVEAALEGRKTNIVMTDSDKDKIKTMRYDDLLAPVVKAIQEQQKEIESLKKEIKELKK